MRPVFCFAMILILSAPILRASAVRGEPPSGASDRADQVENLTLRASEILPQPILRGSTYEVLEFVPVEDDRCLFTVRTEWGQFSAMGRTLLELRLREILVLDLVKSLADEEIKTGKPTVIPISATKLKSAYSSPRGRVLQPEKTADLAVDQPGTTVLLGWGSKDVRRTALEVGCDPDTQQPLVADALQMLSKRQDLPDLIANRKGVQFYPASLLGISYDQRELLESKSSEELQVLFDHQLAEAGVAPEVRQRFCHQFPLSILEKWLLVHEVQGIQSIPGKGDVFSRVVNTEDELAALEVLQELRLINQYQMGNPLKEIRLTPNGVELHLQRGGVGLVRLGDYLTGNPPFQQEMEAFRRTYPKGPLSLVTSAEVSPVAFKVLKNNNITVSAH